MRWPAWWLAGRPRRGLRDRRGVHGGRRIHQLIARTTNTRRKRSTACSAALRCKDERTVAPGLGATVRGFVRLRRSAGDPPQLLELRRVVLRRSGTRPSVPGRWTWSAATGSHRRGCGHGQRRPRDGGRVDHRPHHLVVREGDRCTLLPRLDVLQVGRGRALADDLHIGQIRRPSARQADRPRTHRRSPSPT